MSAKTPHWSKETAKLIKFFHVNVFDFFCLYFLAKLLLVLLMFLTNRYLVVRVLFLDLLRISLLLLLYLATLISFYLILFINLWHLYLLFWLIIAQLKNLLRNYFAFNLNAPLRQYRETWELVFLQEIFNYKKNKFLFQRLFFYVAWDHGNQLVFFVAKNQLQSFLALNLSEVKNLFQKRRDLLANVVF